MNKRRIFFAVLLLVAGVSLVGSWLGSGQLGFIALAVGLVAGGFSLSGTVLLLKVMRHGATNLVAMKAGGVWAVGMFLLKVPILVLTVVYMYRLGDPAPTLFMLGFAMVYCALVGWAITAS